jgi:phosphoribosyl 1,2-cyclic phosphodiesterase
MITQKRRTAGIRMIHGDTNFHIDPGPGALVYTNWARFNPQKLDGVIVTHCHPDHYSDTEVLIEAMSQGTRFKRGVLAAPKSVIEGNSECDRSVSSYHLKLAASVETLSPGYFFRIDNIGFEAVEARHSETDGVGIRFHVPEIGNIGYTSDTGYFEGLGKIYGNVRVLIACAMWPRKDQLRYHLNTEEVLRIVEEAKPGVVFLTHFGMKMVNAGPEKEAEYLENSVNIPVIAAKDGMHVMVGEKVQAVGPRKSDVPRVIDA